MILLYKFTNPTQFNSIPLLKTYYYNCSFPHLYKPIHFFKMPSAVQAADEIWGDVFCEGPYTSVPMLDFLRRRYNLRHVDIMENKNCLRSLAETDSFRRDSTEDQLLGLWASRTGRCTSFAVKVVTILQRKFPGTFDFRFYDLEGRHRLARCSRTGILIDSGSLNGAFVLEEGDLTSFEDDGQSWRWCKGESTFKGVNYKGMPLVSIHSRPVNLQIKILIHYLRNHLSPRP